jgi:hypothetical protein
MKKMILLILFSLLAYNAVDAAAMADTTAVEASPWSGGVQFCATNKYIWRGIPCYEGFLLQPDAWVTYKNLTLEVWNNTMLSAKNGEDKRHELDAILTYEYNLKNLSLKGFFDYYHYINQPDVPSTGELGCVLNYPFGIIKAVATVGVDVIEFSGATYMEAGIELEKELGSNLTIFSSLMLGSGSKKFNEANVGLSESALNFIAVEGHLTYSTSNGWYLQPTVLFSQTMNDDLKEYINQHNTSVGLTIGKEF